MFLFTITVYLRNLYALPELHIKKKRNIYDPGKRCKIFFEIFNFIIFANKNNTF